VDLIGKSGHIRTIPLPGWVRQVLDDWFTASGIRSGRLFRRVNSVVKEFAGKTMPDGLLSKPFSPNSARPVNDRIGIEPTN
jgi:hypothetical protein